MCLGVIHVFCTGLLIWRPNMMAFRVGGALESLQEQYFLLNLCFSMVTFDLQAQVLVQTSIQICTVVIILLFCPFTRFLIREVIFPTVYYDVRVDCTVNVCDEASCCLYVCFC